MATNDDPALAPANHAALRYVTQLGTITASSLQYWYEQRYGVPSEEAWESVKRLTTGDDSPLCLVAGATLHTQAELRPRIQETLPLDIIRTHEPDPPPRRRGGQPGNHNAVTHGAYARFITGDIMNAAAAAGPDLSVTAELQIARATLARHLARSDFPDPEITGKYIGLIARLVVVATKLPLTAPDSGDTLQEENSQESEAAT